MPTPNTAKGPWFHRFLISFFTVLLTLLMVWLIGFVVDDISTLEGPRFEDVAKKFLSQALLQERKTIAEQQAETRRKLEDQRSRQTLLRDSTGRSEKTMNQLVELQRLNAQKEITSEEPQQKALAESVELFLSNQKRDQDLSEDIAHLSEQRLPGILRSAAQRLRQPAARLLRARPPARAQGRP